MRYREEFIREFMDDTNGNYTALRIKVTDDINRRKQRGWHLKSLYHNVEQPISICYTMFKWE